MPEATIAPEMSLFDITEKFPETIDVFVANGYEHVGDEAKRTTNGKMVTLSQAVQMFLPRKEGHQANHHPNTGGTEAPAPAEGFSQVAAQQGGEKSANVDAHVKNRKSGIASWIVLAVESAHDSGDVRFEETHTDDDERQREVKYL